ncbi:hypothetical protein A3H53_03790 [Candidatus Nomurabacteria bacterium RIFCSPLOWO2_02_FULL_40_10]|uniref:TVP38/TMEM64 family membrane protein n=1 Tax=Candidatus Nomurabacteria bacterium RIFCSPLOWO2_02_FULL_40_10 TaxID=1801786 RepID=A0A1F6XVU5_9BACT|nr:MAG: hypothetical protein A3H53_03790 [Candidatus Nomurabacteria bacterium RIFCSPLOWO2_02_FULL_40_10]
MNKNSDKIFLLQDIAIIILSIILAVILVKTDALIKILTSAKELELLGSFIAGIFFTSIFTTAPAIVTLGEIAQTNSIISTALFGGVGAAIGDLIIFHFIRSRFSHHLPELSAYRSIKQKVKFMAKLKFFRWLTFLVGGLIIASPLPDELGISILGFSKMKVSWFIAISLVFNFIGILLIGVVARAF